MPHDENFIISRPNIRFGGQRLALKVPVGK